MITKRAKLLLVDRLMELGLEITRRRALKLVAKSAKDPRSFDALFEQVSVLEQRRDLTNKIAELDAKIAEQVARMRAKAMTRRRKAVSDDCRRRVS